MMTIPLETLDDRCEARFILVRTATGEELFSKPYTIRDRKLLQMVSAGTHPEESNYGHSLSPSLVEALLGDLEYQAGLLAEQSPEP
jgi:hypothetical protein